MADSAENQKRKLVQKQLFRSSSEALFRSSSEAVSDSKVLCELERELREKKVMMKL